MQHFVLVDVIVVLPPETNLFLCCTEVTSPVKKKKKKDVKCESSEVVFFLVLEALVFRCFETGRRDTLATLIHTGVTTPRTVTAETVPHAAD